MSNRKTIKKSRWGGCRAGAGAKPRKGGTVKKCISVTETVWQAAEDKWTGKASRLVDLLLRDYVGSGNQETEAVK